MLAAGRGVPRLEGDAVGWLPGWTQREPEEQREQVCNGNVESWRGVVSADSIIAWHFRSFARKRATARGWLADPDCPPVLVLRSTAEVAAFAEQMGADLTR